jgi:DOMON domain
MKTLGLSVVLLRALCVASQSNAPEDYFGGTDLSPYLNWLVEKGGSYDSSTYFAAGGSDETQGAALHWRVDEEYVYIGVAARAKGWVGLGMADAGGMRGADIVIFEASKPGVLTDTYVQEELMPILDDCQDWTFVDSRTEGGFLIFEGIRKHNTGDDSDTPVIYDAVGYVPAQRIIAAWGDDEVFAYHGNNRARGGIRWYGKGDEQTIFRNDMAEKADGYFDLFVGNHSVKPVVTDYADFCFAWDPDFVVQGVPQNGTISIIAAEIILDPDGGRFVHHATITGGTTTSNASRTCFQNTGLYNTPLYGWAPGTLPFVMPDDVALTIGPGDGNLEAFGGQGLVSFRINMHYNNPELIEGSFDNGGLRVYYTFAKRKHELGVAAFGDIFTHMRGTPIPNGLSQFSFDCSPECSKLAFVDEPVTIVHEYFHMHGHGVSGVQEQIRDGVTVRQANANFFDFPFAGKSETSHQQCLSLLS